MKTNARHHFAFLISLLMFLSAVCLPLLAQKKSTPAAEEKKEYEPEVKQLVSFLEYTLNALGGNELSAKEKDVIVNESYKKLFRDEKVQIEDDLDENREVVTNKDVQAYLKDVDFFFKQVKFKLNIDKISQGINEKGQVYFTVKLNRELKGTTVEGDSVDNIKERYIEINVNDQAQDLRIASIYTTKLSRDEELKAWWAGLSPEWKLYLGSDQIIMEGLRLSEVQSFTDSTFEVNGINYHYDTVKILPFVKAVTNRVGVDIAGSTTITNLDPLDEFTDLKRLNLSNTAIDDLFPIRNLTTLESLDCSFTKVQDLSPLRYSRSLLELNISNTPVTSITVLENFNNLLKLQLAHTVIDSIPGMTSLSKLRELDCSNTNILSLDSISILKNLEQLNCSNTAVSDLHPIESLIKLKHLEFNQTSVSELSPVSKLENLEYVSFYGTPVSELGPLEGLKSLRKVFCDNTKVTREEYAKFYKKRPDCEVVFSSEQLETYWNDLSDNWKKLIAPLIHLDGVPDREQLHDILKIQHIDISGKKDFNSLEPLKVLIDLKWLDISGTSVRDLSPLAEQNALEYIDFSGDDIVDLAPLAKHEQLKIIKGTGSTVTHLSPLQHCLQLDSIFFNNTKIADVSVLNKISGFKIAYFENTMVSDSVVANLTYNSDSSIVVYRSEKLRPWWGTMDDVWQNIFRETYQLSSRPTIEQLHQLAGREKISAKSVNLNNLDPIPVFVRLKELTFTDSQIKSIAPLATLTKLEELHCPRNPIESIEPLKDMKTLKILDIDNTQVSDLDALANLNNLEEVKINGTEVKDLEPLSGHSKLHTLECSNTRIKRVRSLMDMPNIKVLKCFNTRLSDKEVEEFKKARPDCEVVYY